MNLAELLAGQRSPNSDDETEALLNQLALAEDQSIDEGSRSPVSAPGVNQMQQFSPEQISFFLNQQQGNVAKNQDRLKELQEQTDLSPLLALSDSWTGSNFAKSYTSPKKAAADLERYIEKQQGDIAKNFTSIYNRELSSNARTEAAKIGSESREKIANSTREAKAKAAKQPKPLTPFQQSLMDYRTDRLMRDAADSIHKAPNMKTYVDLSNNVGESINLVNQPDVTLTAANEALQGIVRAISRTNVSSDYKLKQFETPTLQGWQNKLETLITSDPNRPAPPEVVKLIQKIGNRVLDNYDGAIKREANRVAQGKIGHFKNRAANDAMKQARDFYTSGAFIEELRRNQGIGPSALPETDTDLKAKKPVGKTAKTTTQAGKTLSQAQLQSVAKRDGITIEQATKKLKDLGYAIGQ